jgi:histidinol-phosphate aminotransferase
MSRFWSPLVSELTPYVPGEQPKQDGLIKLNTNELPWAPSAKVLDAVRAAGNDDLRLYPDPENTNLRNAWAIDLGLRPEQVFVGNGSDEVLAHTFQALFNPLRPILFPDISYSFYPVYCGLYRLPYETVPLSPTFCIDVEEYAKDNGGIIIANPNAPTGIALPLLAIETLLQGNPDSVVVIDEAYVDFGAESACSLIDNYQNLLVVQTLSKSRGLAGLRVGAAFGHVDLIEGLQRVKNSFNSYPLDRVAEAAAVAALEDRDWLNDSCSRLIENRDNLVGSLSGIGFSVLPSKANFILAQHATKPAEVLFQQLRDRGLLVRYFNSARIQDYLRITVGTAQECDQLVIALKEITSAQE